MSERPAILSLTDVSFGYPDEPGLIAHASLSVGPGVTLLYGDTGTGKSALLRVIAGLLPVAGAGSLTVAGVSLADDAVAYRRHVFFCDTASDAFDQMSPRECADELCAGVAGFDEAEWATLVEGFALTPHLGKKLFMLSTGSKRKVWLAAALASGRALTLLDEPTAALDAGSIACLRRALARVAARGERAVLVASAERIDAVPLAGTIELPLR